MTTDLFVYILPIAPTLVAIYYYFEAQKHQATISRFETVMEWGLTQTFHSNRPDNLDASAVSTSKYKNLDDFIDQVLPAVNKFKRHSANPHTSLDGKYKESLHLPVIVRQVENVGYPNKKMVEIKTTQ